MIKVASLFSGAGGLDLGFELAGKYRVVFANEILKSAATTYSKNFGLKLYDCAGKRTEAQEGYIYACDVANVDFSPLKDEGIDVVIGGPPCQDFSLVRGPDWDRKGIEVRRGRLYSHFVRALVQLQPKVFVFENVPGLKSANKGLAYKVILEDFIKLNLRWEEVKKTLGHNNNGGDHLEGYELLYSKVADFSSLGVPQSRQRLIIIGVRKDLISDVSELWEVRGVIEKHLRGKPWLFRKYPLTPLEVFEGKRLDELGDKYREIILEWEDVWREVNNEHASRWKKEVWDKLTFDVVKDYLRTNGVYRYTREELERALEQHEELLRELGYLGRPVYELKLSDSTTELPRDKLDVVERMKRIPPGENHEFVRGTPWEVEGRGISLVYRRIHPLKPSYTIVAYGGGGTHGYHYDRKRATLTLREKARLQTFPDSFLFYGNKGQKRAQIGEAVPPLAGKRIAEAVLEVMKELELL